MEVWPYMFQRRRRGDVTKKKAMDTISSGKVFESHDAGFFSPKYGDHCNLRPHMFYRQASLFVAFMNECDNKAFEKMLVALDEARTI